MSDGLQCSFSPSLSQIVDLDGVTHSKKIRDKGSLSASLGFVSNELLEQIKDEISKSDVLVQVGVILSTFTSMSVSASASYIYEDEIYWDNVTISGVEK